MAASIRKAGLSCVCFSNFHTMAEHWRALNPAIAIVDAPIADEFFRCRKEDEFFRCRKEDESFCDLPVIEFVQPDAESRTKAFAAGAMDCIVKPVISEELLGCLRTHLASRSALSHA
ncbi:response regulator transcription factor [Rhizobium leucaenae]|uniref:response regulator transcription factor n=1 Tax=Rhizobium leucaenae TaxID=29450 RepID=UPI001620CD6C|nr:response regulator transcription factor [Rhizobium leucaenae]MBB6304180.1 DNA-binding response OmpR family regulator [Rhizobium leucaenae]